MQIKLLDFQWFLSICNARDQDIQFRTLWDRCVGSYFDGLSMEYFDDFWDQFRCAQDLTIASGAPFLDDRQMRLTPSSNLVSVFNASDGSWGHVSPYGHGFFVVDLASADRRIPLILDKLKVEFGVDDVANLKPPLKNYVNFVAKAKRYLAEGLLDESFLHYVIALELLFGERQRTAESISHRVAPLIYSSLQLSLGDGTKKLNAIYDARSRYVHRGISVEPNLLAEVAQICEEVLWALMRVLSRNPFQTDPIEQWTKNLDYVYSALIAGKSISVDERQAIGVPPRSVSQT